MPFGHPLNSIKHDMLSSISINFRVHLKLHSVLIHQVFSVHCEATVVISNLGNHAHPDVKAILMQEVE